MTQVNLAPTLGLIFGVLIGSIIFKKSEVSEHLFIHSKHIYWGLVLSHEDD